MKSHNKWKVRINENKEIRIKRRNSRKQDWNKDRDGESNVVHHGQAVSLMHYHSTNEKQVKITKGFQDK
jgi:hypothetical protein